MAALEPHCCEPNNYSPNSESYSSKDSEVDNRLEIKKKGYAGLVKESQLQVFLFLPISSRKE